MIIYWRHNEKTDIDISGGIDADELFNGLDKDGVKDMREYLLSYKEQGKTILICSHSA